MNPSPAEPTHVGKPTTAQDLGRHYAYVAIPAVLLAIDLLNAWSGQAGGCAGLAEAWDLVTFNMGITFLTWIACCIEIARGQRSAQLTVGICLNSAWMLPVFISLWFLTN